jgi:2EXR family
MSSTVLHSFRLLPPELRIMIWKSSLTGRVVKISPKNLTPGFKCHHMSFFGGLNLTCCCHANPGTPPPSSFSASIEARKETMRFYQPMRLGQVTEGHSTWIRYEIDTVMLSDCFGTPVRMGPLVSWKGFDDRLIQSPDWHKIQHLAMDWDTFQYADILKGRKQVYTKEILKMNNLRTFTLVVKYTWNAADGTADALVNPEEDMVEDHLGASMVPELRHKTTAKKCQKVREEVEEAWRKAVSGATERLKRLGVLDGSLNVPQLEIKSLRMMNGHVLNYWDNREEEVDSGEKGERLCRAELFQ